MTRPPSQPLRRSFVPAKQGASRHYGSHPYFTKRAWNVVQEYIRHFSSQGDTVLDPFGGSGVTAVESLVLRRKAIYVDISQWACFLARQTAIAPVDIGKLRDAFLAVDEGCRQDILDIWATPNRDLKNVAVRDWYPKKVRLPDNSDVQFVEELFTPRMLHGLARLRAEITKVTHKPSRDLLLFAFSSTLARINCTFLSASNRRESRGGAAIFSIYRYKVAKEPVELPLWDQFAKRVDRLVVAKRETNELIGDFYEEDTAVFKHGSATRLLNWLEPGSVDYIYTDPPYGAHIAYLDLSTMWAAWLGMQISPTDRTEEAIEGGQLRKSHDVYHHLMTTALQQMYEILRTSGWMSIVFAHRDTTYWESLVDACSAAGFKYVNTLVQPVGVVWSMHKKKNPLRVLSGELVLNFRKTARPAKRRKPKRKVDAATVVRQCCERTIIEQVGATTENLHHSVVPKLLETGLLTEFSRECGDITPMFERHFRFDEVTAKWYLREEEPRVARVSETEFARYHIQNFLSQRNREGLDATESEVLEYVESRLSNGRTLPRKEIKKILSEVACCPDKRNWRLMGATRQQEFSFTP